MKGLCSAPFLHDYEKETKMELLKVENLSVKIGGQKDKVNPVRDVSFSLQQRRGACNCWRIRMWKNACSVRV